MSMGPLGFIGSAAGSPLAQTKGSEVERSQQDARDKQRQTRTDTKAADAAGIGATDGEDNQAHERDADGRRLWERPPGDGQQPSDDADQQASDPSVEQSKRSKDASGESGNQLDLLG